MKQFITALMTVAVMASPSFGATYKYAQHSKKRTTVKTSPAVDVKSPEVSTHHYSSGYASTTSFKDPQFSADLGLGTIDSLFMFGFGLRVDFPTHIDNEMFTFGGQTGFYDHPSDGGAWTIPVLVTGHYHFKTSSMLKPYVGLGMGISITHVPNNTSTDFAMLFKPGVNFGTEHAFYVELPIGTIASSFAFIPSFGLHF